jgi:hypothetical protein
MMKRLLRSYVYNGFVWELNCSTSGELNDDKSSTTSIVEEKVSGESYIIDYIVSAPNAPTRHIQSVFAVRPQESVVGLTVQAPEDVYQANKATIDKILPSLEIDISQ